MKEMSETRTMVSSSNSVKILKGLIISCIITFVLMYRFAAVLTYTDTEENTIGPVIIAITGVSILSRKLYGNKFNKEKWNIKWRNNRFCIYNTYIYSIKHNGKWICLKYLFNNNDGSWNYCWNDRRGSTE